MVQLRSLLRFAALLGTATIFGTCAHTTMPNPPSPSGGSGFAGTCGARAMSTNRDAPIVCVDDTGPTLVVTPDPIRLNCRHSMTHNAVELKWVTKSGTNDLGIEMTGSCVEPVQCEKGHGACKTKALPMPLGAKDEKQCKYTIWTDKHPKLDPDVIITPCC